MAVVSLLQAACIAAALATCFFVVRSVLRHNRSVSFYLTLSGALSLLSPTGVSGDLGAGAMPLDLDMSRNGSFLYVMKNGTGTIGGFAVAGDGSLSPLADTPGLVARAGYMGLAAY